MEDYNKSREETCLDDEDADHLFMAPSCSDYRDKMAAKWGPTFGSS